MHGLSTILSLIFKLIGKIFRTFGINAILLIFFVIELIACVSYVSEMSDYDKNSRDYEFTGVESVVELEKDDPILKEYDVLTSDYDHYYLACVTVENSYSERLSFPAMSAETESGDLVVVRRITYYGDDMADHSVSAYIPAGTRTKLTYMIEISDYRLAQTDCVILCDFTGDKEQSLTIPIPK